MNECSKYRGATKATTFPYNGVSTLPGKN